MPTRDGVRAALPELALIEDEALREQTLDVWTDARVLGGWAMNDLPDIPFTLLVETKVSLLDHTRVVTQTAVAIHDAMSADGLAAIGAPLLTPDHLLPQERDAHRHAYRPYERAAGGSLVVQDQ